MQISEEEWIIVNDNRNQISYAIVMIWNNYIICWQIASIRQSCKVISSINKMMQFGLIENNYFNK